MKKIGIDLDGVVFDSENLYRVYTEIYDVDILKKDSLIDNSQRVFQKRYDWIDEEKTKFYDTYSHDILKNSNVMPGADIVLKKLSQGYELVIITSRNDDELEYAKDFFNKIGLENVKIYNNQIKKIDKIIQEKLDYIIDDDIDICLEASEQKICTLYFRNSACKNIEENAYLKLVNNWGEIYKFMKLKKVW